MTNKLGRLPFKYCISLRDKKGELVMLLDDEDGGPFASERAALARLADAERQYPEFKVSVEKSYEVNLDGDPDDAPKGEVQGIAHCPSKLPAELVAPLRLAAELWQNSSLRPRVTHAMLATWDELLSDWIADVRAPLLVRKSAGTRGQIVHHCTGRLIVPVDNTPAHWSLGLALTGKCPSLDEVHAMFDQDAIPIAMAFAKSELARAKYTGRHARWLGRLNQMGWKVCHVIDVGIGTKVPLAKIPIEILTKHFRALLEPSNMFLVPMVWAGFGELPEVQARFSAVVRPRVTP